MMETAVLTSLAPHTHTHNPPPSTSAPSHLNPISTPAHHSGRKARAAKKPPPTVAPPPPAALTSRPLQLS